MIGSSRSTGRTVRVVAVAVLVMGLAACAGFRVERDGRKTGDAICDLKDASSASLFNWSRRSLYCLTRLRRTTLPPMLVVLPAPRSPLMTPEPVAPTKARSMVDRLVIRNRPPSFEAVT